MRITGYLFMPSVRSLFGRKIDDALIFTERIRQGAGPAVSGFLGRIEGIVCFFQERFGIDDARVFCRGDTEADGDRHPHGFELQGVF